MSGGAGTAEKDSFIDSVLQYENQKFNKYRNKSFLDCT